MYDVVNIPSEVRKDVDDRDQLGDLGDRYAPVRITRC